ncbi:MAG: LuxR C-terminal-related transcriptional regulator [Panacagrimonas sp.]
MSAVTAASIRHGPPRAAAGGKIRLARPRLALPEALRDGECSIATLFAPAGYGKSTVMSQWRNALEQAGIACAWLRLRGRHHDPKILLKDLLACLEMQVGANLCPATQKNLRSITSFAVEPVLNSMARELSRSGTRLALFFDDLEALNQSDGTRTIMGLLEFMPKQVCFVLGGRDAAQLPLRKYALAGETVELGPGELQFTLDEARQLLAELHGVELGGDALSEVLKKTEGWAAALHLCAVGMSDARRSQRFLSHFSGAEGDLAEYLNESVFSGLNPQMQDFLMRVAVPGQFGLSLAQHLAPEHDVAGLLDHALHANIFLYPVDDGHDEYRFHALYRDFLSRRLRAHAPKRWVQVLIATGDWYWDHGHQGEAIESARLAEDWQTMGQRLSSVSEAMTMHHGEHLSYLKWLGALPEQERNKHPELLFHQAWALDVNKRTAESEAALCQLEKLLPDLEAEAAQDLTRRIRLLRMIRETLRDRGQVQLDALRAWDRDYPDAPMWERGLMNAGLASSARNANQLELAFRALDAADEALADGQRDYVLAWARVVRISVLTKGGRFADARAYGKKALAAISEELGGDSEHAGMCHAQLSYLAYENNELSAAGDYLAEGLRFIEAQGVVEPLYAAYLTQTLMALDQNKPELAIATLADGEQRGMDIGLPRLTLQLATRRAITYLSYGEHVAAQSVIRGRQLLDYPKDEFVTYRAQCAQLLRIHFALANGQYLEAQSVLKDALKKVRTQGNLRLAMEYDYLLAIATHHVGDNNEAGRRFRELLALAGVEGRWRFMLHGGKQGQAMIAEQLKARKASWDGGEELDLADQVLQQLAAALGMMHPQAVGVDDQIADGLTRRETEILRRAAQSGLSNRRLAKALFVSEGTLKWHLHNIYEKLGVRNRAGAIAQAQRLGMLQ